MVFFNLRKELSERIVLQILIPLRRFEYIFIANRIEFPKCNTFKQRSRTDTRSDVERQRPLRDGTTLENKGTQSRIQSRIRPNLKCLTLEMPNSNYPQRPQRRKQRTEPQSHIQRRAARNVQGQRTANDNNSCRVVVVVPGGTGC